MGNAQCQGVFGRSALHLGGKTHAVALALHANLAQGGHAADLVALVAHLHCAGPGIALIVGDRHGMLLAFALCTQGDDHKLLAHLHPMPGHLARDAGRARAVAAVHVRGQGNQKQRIVVRHIGGHKAMGVVFGNEAGVEVA